MPADIGRTPSALADYGGIHYLRFVLELAHAASVPIAVHLDHATTDEDIDTALRFAEAGVAFDSIMVDASHADTDEENLAIVRSDVCFCPRLRCSR
jgi:fructose-bisphosphate aldolase class II